MPKKLKTKTLHSHSPNVSEEYDCIHYDSDEEFSVSVYDGHVDGKIYDPAAKSTKNKVGGNVELNTGGIKGETTDIEGSIHGPNFYTDASYNQKSMTAQTYAQINGFQTGIKVMNSTKVDVRALTASARASCSPTEIGAGIKATIVELSADSKPLAATIGLGVNTEARLGTKGMTVKVAGTGISADKAGLGISVLGNELKIKNPLNWFS